MSTIGTAYVQIVPSTEGIGSELSKSLSGEMGSAGESGGSSFASKFVSIAKTALAAAGLGKVVSEAFNAGADYEQLVGGVETLFEGSSQQVIQYANNAFETAGISANDYMETVTSFAASLKQSVGGDMDLLATSANQAVIDMADNANKMGTNMSSIQDAYQGFAKQNYTMLDNLKLGYGGTKSEMERLLADAEKLSGVKYDINNLNDVYSAIHVIQTDLGITGTTAEEASTTFSGSMNAMKAAAENLLATWTTGGDLNTAISNLTNSAYTFLMNNAIPMLGRFIEAIPTVLSGAKDALLQALDLVSTHSSEILSFGMNIIVELANGIITSVPQLLTAGVTLIGSLADAFFEYDWVSTASGMIGNLVNSISETLPTIIASAGTIIASLVEGIVQNLPQIIQSGIQLILSLAKGLIEALPDIVSSLLGIIEDLGEIVKNYDWIAIGGNIISGIMNGLWQLADSLFEAAADITSQLVASVKNLLGIHSPSKVFAGIGEYMMLGLSEGIDDNVKTVQDAVGAVADSTVGGLTADYAVTMNAATSAMGYTPSGSGNMYSVTAESTATQNALLSKQNELLQQILEKTGVSLDGKMLKASINRYSRATGV